MSKIRSTLIPVKLTRFVASISSMACIACIVCIAAASLAHANERFSDPTRPPSALSASAQAKAGAPANRPLELQAILHAAGRRVAIINGRRVHENESIESARIITISKDSVRLTRSGKAIELSLKHESIKKTGSSSRRNTSSRAAKNTARAGAEEGISK